MSNYRELQGLPDPVIHASLIKCMKHVTQKNDYVKEISDFESILSPALLDAFDNIGISPINCYLFGFAKNQQQKIWIHTDIVSDDNQWVRLPFGINWELVPSTTIFNWWDVEGQIEHYPDASMHAPGQRRLQGIHYSDRVSEFTDKTVLDFDRCKIIESVEFKHHTPYMVKVGIPHNVEYKTTHSQRIGLSVRFPIHQIPTWERALEVFDTFIKK
jgi:hypothetical protein